MLSMMTMQVPASRFAPKRPVGRPKISDLVATLVFKYGGRARVLREVGASPRDSFKRAAFGSFAVEGGRPVLRDGLASAWGAKYFGPSGAGTMIAGERTSWKFSPASRREL